MKLSKFVGEDYTTWKAVVRAVLQSKSWYLVIERETPAYAASADAATIAATTRTFKEIDAKVRSLILTSLDLTVARKVACCENSYQLWHRMNEIYEKTGLVHKNLVKEALYSYKKSKDDDMATHISKVEDLCAKLECLGEKVDEHTKVSRVVCSLGPQ